MNTQDLSSQIRNWPYCRHTEPFNIGFDELASFLLPFFNISFTVFQALSPSQKKHFFSDILQGSQKTISKWFSKDIFGRQVDEQLAFIIGVDLDTYEEVEEMREHLETHLPSGKTKEDISAMKSIDIYTKYYLPAEEEAFEELMKDKEIQNITIFPNA